MTLIMGQSVHLLAILRALFIGPMRILVMFPPTSSVCVIKYVFMTSIPFLKTFVSILMPRRTLTNAF